MALLSPQQGRHLWSSLLTDTFQFHRGDTMYQGYSDEYNGLTVSQAAHRIDGLRDSNCAHKVGHGKEKG